MDYSNYSRLSKLPRKHLNDIIFVKSTYIDRLHATMGLTGEVGKVSEIIKKHVFYAKPLDMTHLKEEMGDVLFYFVWLLDEMGLTLEEVMDYNIDKLSKRYPNEFNKGE